MRIFNNKVFVLLFVLSNLGYSVLKAEEVQPSESQNVPKQENTIEKSKVVDSESQASSTTSNEAQPSVPEGGISTAPTEEMKILPIGNIPKPEERELTKDGKDTVPATKKEVEPEEKKNRCKKKRSRTVKRL